MGTSDEPQLSTQDIKCQDNPAELPSVSTLFSLSSFRKYPYHSHRRDRNFLRGGLRVGGCLNASLPPPPKKK